jgi:hypothetical protein
MKYTPEDISAANLNIAGTPAQGVDKVLYISTETAKEVGEFAFTTTGSGEWTPDSVFTVPADSDLVARAEDFLLADSAIVLHVSDGFGVTGTATFAAPSYVKNQTADWQPGISFDVVPDVPGEQFEGALTVWASGGQSGASIKLFILPAESSWVKLGCVEDFNPKVGSEPAVPVPCGRKGSAYVVRGRSEPNNVTVNSKYFSVADDLMRFNNRRCAIRMDLKKQNVAIIERQVCDGLQLMVNPEFPDNEIARQVAEGIFENWFGFPAPSV